MAQHDYTIANQGFPAFRSDLNDALAAIVSNNSGATEPTTMFAHQMWVDTAADPSVLKIRNADNDAWITIGTINQTGDTFTLTSAVSATTLNTSGAVVFNDAGADVDFRVEGDTDANLLFVDASADKVGVGTTSLTYKLEVNGAIRGKQNIYVGRASDNAVIGVISEGSSSGFLIEAAAGGSDSTIQFKTSATERARIDSSGNLLVGTTDSSVQQSAGFKFVANATSPYVGQVINTSGVYNTYHLYNESATNNGYRFYVKSDGGVANFSGNNVNLSDERMKTNIEIAGSYLEKICAIPVKLFNYQDEREGEQKTLGVIAQDVESIAPEFVNQDGWLGNPPEGESPLKSIYTTDMMFGLMKAIQELKAELDTVKAELATLKG